MDRPDREAREQHESKAGSRQNEDRNHGSPNDILKRHRGDLGYGEQADPDRRRHQTQRERDDRDDQVRLELEPGEYLVQLSSEGNNTGLIFSKADGEALDAAVMTKLFPVLSEAFAERRQNTLLDAPRR